MAQLAEKPFFIVGSPRSGTTLLRFILSSHPRIYIPSETGFLPFLTKDVEAELGLDDVRQILEHIGRLNRFWDGMVADLPTFYEALPGPQFQYILDALYRQRIAEHGAVRWGDKTPTYVRHLRILSKAFPTAQFVHVIRDGRDATLSAQSKWGAGHWYMDNYYLLNNWVANVRAGQQAGQALGPERYLEVRYETLVRQPASVIAEVCAFLGEELHPQMLDHTKLAQQQIGPGGHIEVREPISTASVQRWKAEMAPFDQKLANRLAGDLLEELGYERAAVDPLSGGETLRLVFLAGKFRLADTARTLLYTTGILSLNRDLRR